MEANSKYALAMYSLCNSMDCPTELLLLHADRINKILFCIAQSCSYCTNCLVGQLTDCPPQLGVEQFDGPGVFQSVGTALWEEQPLAEHASRVADDSVQRMTGIVQNGQQFGLCSSLCHCRPSDPALLISFSSLDRSALDMLPAQHTTV